jgi:ATP-binding cassette subfamily B protein
MTVERAGGGSGFGTLRRTAADRWSLIRLLPKAGLGVAAVSVLDNLLLAAAPVVFVEATSRLIGRLPAAVSAGVHSAAFSALVGVFLVAAVALSLQQLFAQIQLTLAELIKRLVDEEVADELMAAALSARDMAPLEDPELLDRLAEAAREVEQSVQSPGAGCAAMVSLVARYGQLAGYCAAVGAAFTWWAGCALFAAVSVFRHGQRGGLRRYAAVYGEVIPHLRKLTYFRRLGTGAGAAKEIRVFGLLPWVRRQYQESYLDWMRPVWADRRRVYLKPYFGYTAVGLSLAAAMLAALGYRGAHREVGLSAMALVVQASLAAIQLGDFYPEADVQTQFGMIAYRALSAFRDGVRAHDAAARVPAARAGDPPAATEPAVVFENVFFRYPSRTEPVFAGLDLTIPAGRCTAVVGVNGAGKTTLVKLLTGLALPDRGRITVAGRAVAGSPDGRAPVAAIFQDYLRYETSAADNIALGSIAHAGDLPGIRAAAATAGVLQALEELPRGLETPLHRQLAGGVDLSGGQWQRVAIARALFAVRHGASVLVLDEPTASLDARAEAGFYDEVIAATAGLTTILISHRFATVRRADHIVVLDGGVVAEQGTHEELLERRGRYARLFDLQAARFAERSRLRPYEAGDEPEDDEAGHEDGAALPAAEPTGERSAW